MTSSLTRLTAPRTAPRPGRRTALLAASALCGMATMLAQPALAGTLPGIPSAANITVSSGGSQPFISFPDAITLQIELNAPRTVINWTDLHLSSGDAMNFLFDSASDIVLNKTTSQIRFDNGSVVTGKVGAATAGNVWFYSPQGVIVSPGATMTAGGFLFSKGSGLVDATFVDSAAPLTFLRSAADALIQMTTVSSATSASINGSGDVVLSASSGALNVTTALGATVDISTTSGSITASEVTASSGAATVAAGGPGATVTQISGATGVTVSSNANTSVGSATTTTSGDILLTSNGSASLTLGNSARDVTLSAPQVFVSTIDAARDVFITGETTTYVTNRIFAGDDIEITASNGDVSAGGAYLKSTGFGASDDAHILLRSDTGAVDAGNTLLTQGTGAQAGDITIQAVTTASLGTASSTRDIKVSGVTASLSNGTAARDIFVTATTGGATVTTAATAGDDIEVTATTGDISASGATLKSTGVGATDDAHVLVRSTSGKIDLGTAITQGTGAAAGDVTISANGDVDATGATASGSASVTSTVGFVNISTVAASGGTASVSAGDVANVGSISGRTGATVTATSDILLGVANTTVSGDVVVQSGATATVSSASSARDLKISGKAAKLTTGTAAGDLFVTASAGAATVVTSATAGDDVEVTAAGGAVVAGGATLKSTGVGAVDDAHVLARSTTGAVNVGSAITQGTGVAAGDVTIRAATTATASLGSGDASRDLTVAGRAATLTSGSAARDLFVTATTGDATVTTSATAGDDVEVTATSGNILASGATLKSTGVGAADDAHVLAQSTSGSVTVGSGITQGTGVAVGDVTIAAGAAAAATLGSGDASRDVKVSGATAAITTGTAARDIILTAISGAATVTTSATAGDDVIVNANGDVLAGGATLKGTGTGHVGAPGSMGGSYVYVSSSTGAVNVGTAITEGTGAAAGDVVVSASTTATLGSGGASRDLKLYGATSSLTTGSAARDLFVDASSGNATITTSATAGDDVEITANTGAVSASGATLKSTGVGATDDAHVLAKSTNGAVNVGTAITQGTGVAAGDVTLDAGDTINAGTMTASRDFTAIAAGTVDVTSATSGRDITVTSNGGDATLGAAVLTGSGSGYDLSITASGNAVLGDPDYAAITAANVFSRTGGNTGTASVKSTGGGDAMVHLDTSAAIDTVEGAGVDITIASGLASFGTLTALTGDLYAESYDGGMTVDTATADNGTLDLYVAGGDLTITGSVHGGDDTHLETDGLLDGLAATLISSDADLSLSGGSVKLDHIKADGRVEVGGVDDVEVALAEAGQTVEVGSANGAATLGAAKGPDGVTLIAGGAATFGAVDKASIDATHYVETDATCGCGSGGLVVVSGAGSAVININSATNGIAAVGSLNGNTSVVLKTGDLKIDEAFGYDIALEAVAGTLETGLVTSFGGDYAVTAHDFLGDALTPYLDAGVIRDVTITDTLGDLDLGTLALHADRKLTITAQDGAVKGLAQLDAGTGVGDGEISVTGQGVSIDTAEADHDVALDAGTGTVTVATSVTAGYDYHLTGAGFSTNALSPLGDRTGSWFIKVPAGYDFDFTGHDLNYVGGIGVEMVDGDLTGGAVTSDAGNIYLEANNARVAALSATNGRVTAHANLGDALIGSATAEDQIVVTSNLGDARLGAAVLTGAGTNSLLVRASGGDVVLGAATPGAITMANIVTSAGAATTVEASTATGKVDVNLDHTTMADLTTIDALNGVNIKVVDGVQRIIAARSITGAVKIDGPTGALVVDGLTANADSQVNGGGDTRLISALIDGDLTVSSATGNLRFGDAVPGRLVEVTGALTLDAATDIAQQGALSANSLGVTAGTGAVLLGANKVSYLDAVSVVTGGFAFNDTLGFDLYGPIDAVGQTVDLRSSHAIGQVSTGIITAQTLTGSSVGGANFGAANQVVQLGAFSNTGGGLLKLVDGRSLTVSGVVSSTGSVALTSHAGMTFAAGGRVTADGTGDAIVLASDGTFTNARGADAVTATHAGGRWLIYSQAVGNAAGSTSANSFNGLAGKSYYGSAYDFSNEVLAVAPNAGNRFVYAYRPTLTVTPDSRTVIYNGSVPTTSATITGLVNGDVAADAWSGTAAVSGATSKNVGTYVLTASAGSLASDLNYAFSYGTGSLRIDAKTITGLLDADDKIYDRSIDATGAIILADVVAGDDVEAAGTYTFADWNAGAGKTVTASGVSLSGGDAGNYILSPVSTAQAEIFRKAITGALIAGDKTYDGLATTSGTIGLTGVITGDTVSASGVYAFADQNAGVGKTVTVSGAALAGAQAGNYDLTSVSGDVADILRRQVTVSADTLFKPFGHVDPPLSYRITVGGLVAGEAFTGAIARDVGETPGPYAITRGTLSLSPNYELTFNGAVFTIDPLPSNEQDGSPALKHVGQSPDFTLDWDPELNLGTSGDVCPADGCPSSTAASGGGKVVAALR